MKIKYYVVEYISYQSENGYPGLGTDPRTMERIHFPTKKEAKRFIKRFMKDDPNYVRMWIAHISLHFVTQKIKIVKFPPEWADDALISKKERANVYKEALISENKAAPSAELTDYEYYMSKKMSEQLDMFEYNKKNYNQDVKDKEAGIASPKHVAGQLCPLNVDCDAVRCQNHRYKEEDKKESDTFQA